MAQSSLNYPGSGINEYFNKQTLKEITEGLKQFNVAQIGQNLTLANLKEWVDSSTTQEKVVAGLVGAGALIATVGIARSIRSSRHIRKTELIKTMSAQDVDEAALKEEIAAGSFSRVTTPGGDAHSALLEGTSPLSTEDQNRLRISNLSRRRVLVLGLDGAGKTEVVKKIGQREPTVVGRFADCIYVTCFATDEAVMKIWEVKGTAPWRRHWGLVAKEGFDLLCWVVDSTDSRRFQEAAQALEGILNLDVMESVPLLILATRQESPDAVEPRAIIEALKVNNVSPNKRRVVGLPVQLLENGTTKGLRKAQYHMVHLSKLKRMKQTSEVSL